MRLLLSVALLACFSLGTTFAADPIIGTWKMNVAKSKFSPGPAPQNVNTVYTEEGEWIVTTSTGLEASGKPINRTNRYKMDGKEYPFEGPQGKGTISLKRVDGYTTEAVIKYPGGHTTTSRSVISSDGRTRTMTSTGTNAKGEKVNSVVVWDRQ